MKYKELFEEEPEVLNGNITIRAVTSLYYHNKIVNGDFSCQNFNILSLEGSPIKVTGYFDCSNTGISSLKGCPREVGKDYYCYNAPNLKSLHNVHKYVNRIGGYLEMSANIVESHILGVLKIRDLRRIYLTSAKVNVKSEVAEIINRYLYKKPNPATRDIHGCQEELIDAGLAEYAQL